MIKTIISDSIFVLYGAGLFTFFMLYFPKENEALCFILFQCWSISIYKVISMLIDEYLFIPNKNLKSLRF